MKISSFYFTNISSYDEFNKSITSYIDDNFYGKGYSSLSIGRFIKYLRHEFSFYASYKFDKKINVIVTIPRIDYRLIEKKIKNNKDYIYIRLNFNKIKNILQGEYNDYDDYIDEIIEQFEEYVLQKNPGEFKQYLIIQMDNLVDICFNELSIHFDEETLKDKITKYTEWVKLSRKSAIFKEYFELFTSNKSLYSEMFCNFLKKIGKKLN